MSDSTVHEVFAVKFAQNDEGLRGHFFLGEDGEPHDEPMQLDYFVWLIRSAGQDIVLDAGFTARTNERRQRVHLEDPTSALAKLGVDPATVPFVILSHLHYDHVGDLEPFTAAQFVLQSDELGFWTGPSARHHEFNRYIEVEDIQRVVRLNIEGRVRLIDGAREIVDGVWVIKVGGHTPGMQATVVRTAEGMLVLAADASHFFENVENDRAFAVHTDLPQMFTAFEVMRDAASEGRVIAGHDPALFDRYPAVPGLEGRALRIA